MTVWFIDNNIILQLAAYNLFEETLAAFSIAWADLRVLNTAVYVFQGKGVARNYSPETVKRAVAIVKQCQTVLRQPTNEFELLLKINGIDEGEASLIAATATEAAFLIVTGDKRSLCALTSAPIAENIHQRIVGRVICLEQVLLKLILVHGAEQIQQQISATSDSEIEKAINISFGWSQQADPESIQEGLNSYINGLQDQSKGLLAKLIEE